jgi:methylated-DNA-[protein]-cysteine S-methyltransferase
MNDRTDATLDSTTPDDATLAALRARLAAEADAQDLLDLTHRRVDSPVGALLLVASPQGLVRVAFDCEDHDAVLDHLAATLSPRILASQRRTEEAARQLGEYFERRRRRFELPLDLRLISGFRRTVVERLADIPYGRTESYAAMAASAGNPSAVRAAGSACSHNPVPVVVPCHRVVRSDGTIGNYLGGTAAKRALLDLESSAA